jgi:hypothetical protein
MDVALMDWNLVLASLEITLTIPTAILTQTLTSKTTFKTRGRGWTMTTTTKDPSIATLASFLSSSSTNLPTEEVTDAHCDRLERIGLADGNKDKLDDALSVIKDAEEKFYLYMAHKTRVAQAQDSSSLMDEQMQQEVREMKQNGTTMMLVIDWKMKFKPQAFREATSEHYGKRGISWHGVFAYFYQFQIDEGNGQEYLERVVVKADQIMNGDSNQDGEAVLSMVEAFLHAIEMEFSLIKSAIICSDNAGCYHKKELVFGYVALNLIKGRTIRIERVIHSETQDGKCLIDAHFARGTRQVIMYIKTTSTTENKRVTSPRELAEALAWNGGIQNSSVHYLQLDRSRPTEFKEAIATAATTAMDFFSRASEIQFVKESFRNNKDLCLSDPESCKEIVFRLRAWAYSGIGEGALFDCNVGDGTFITRLRNHF